MKFFLLAIIIAATLAAGESLQCYACYPCDDQFASKVNGTESGCPACAKQTWEYTDDTEQIRRGCINPIDLSTTTLDVSRAEKHLKSIHLYICEEDLCNGAASVSSIFLLSSILAVTSRFI